jgi:hypothetical protein
MIRSHTRVISFTTGRKTHQDRRPAYGKIKVVPPSGQQAIATACLPAGASVGARAAQEQKRKDTNMDFGTCALPLFERADK